MVLLGVFMSMGALIMGNLLQVSGRPFCCWILGRDGNVQTSSFGYTI